MNTHVYVLQGSRTDSVIHRGVSTDSPRQTACGARVSYYGGWTIPVENVPETVNCRRCLKRNG